LIFETLYILSISHFSALYLLIPQAVLSNYFARFIGIGCVIYQYEIGTILVRTAYLLQKFWSPFVNRRLKKNFTVVNMNLFLDSFKVTLQDNNRKSNIAKLRNK